MKQSQMSGKVGLSETIAIDEKVKKLRAEGRRVISFGAGQPDAPTPASVCEAGIKAIRGGATKYTSPGGCLELRQAICEKLARDNGLAYQPDQIVVSAGAKQSIFMALAVIVDPGEEVLLPAPYWVSYPTQVSILGGTSRVLPTDERTGFKITAAQLRDAITPRTACLILNSPSNPTGAVYSRAELEAIGEVVLETGIQVVTDEIYERIVFGGAEHVSLASLSPELKALTAVVNGVSKAYSMTGWRIGYFAAEPEWAERATALQSHLSGNPCSVSQEAAIEALLRGDESVREMVSVFGRRREKLLGLLRPADRLGLCPPDGAFYAFPDVSGYFGLSAGGAVLEDDVALAGYLIEEAGVALVPGSGFGSPRHVRLSFATSDQDIEDGVQSMVAALGKLG
ncbi:MAG: pyridoxal phosphate-dependent aminotransferase [Candidatus Eisenbacteria bacterium]